MPLSPIARRVRAERAGHKKGGENKPEPAAHYYTIVK